MISASYPYPLHRHEEARESLHTDSTSTTVNFRLVHRDSSPVSASPYRLLDSHDREVGMVNAFLDAQCIRGLSLRSLRAYGYDLLNFAQWWFQARRRHLSRLNESRLLDYVRFQLDRKPKPTPQTVNHRLTVLRCLYRFHYAREIPRSRGSVLSSYSTRGPLGYGKPRRVTTGLRLRQPRRVVVPLCAEEVSQFWQSFRTYRDLSLIALMLFDGLRSREAMEVQLEDLRLSQAQILISGKGNRQRVLPLPDETIEALEHYIHLERPLTNSPYLFVSLKGPHRGRPMTAAGLRSLFRHHRCRTNVRTANPHRFRHTFGADMVRAGISLPALMNLMGHSNIHTTMLYVQLSPQDVWREYHLAMAKKARFTPPVEP